MSKSWNFAEFNKEWSYKRRKYAQVLFAAALDKAAGQDTLRDFTPLQHNDKDGLGCHLQLMWSPAFLWTR